MVRYFAKITRDVQAPHNPAMNPLLILTCSINAVSIVSPTIVIRME